MQKKNLHLIMNILTILSLLACAAFVVYGIKTRIFFSQPELTAFLDVSANLRDRFRVFSGTQVVFPILPGGSDCSAGLFSSVRSGIPL
jgi:hypothetical protein